MKGRQLDLWIGDDLQRAKRSRAQAAASGESSTRRFLGVHFICCDVYTRVYMNRAGTGYEGNCPKCCQPVRFRVGPDGTSARFFTAS